jgi:hypothetical protein
MVRYRNKHTLDSCTAKLALVVVEKAFTNTAAEADQLVEIAKKSGKILTVYQSKPRSIIPIHHHIYSVLMLNIQIAVTTQTSAHCTISSRRKPLAR